MANIKINELPSKLSIDNDDLVIVGDSSTGELYKNTVEELLLNTPKLDEENEFSETQIILDKLYIGDLNPDRPNNTIGMSVNKVVTVLDCHAYEDNSFLRPLAGTVLGYCSFDAIVTIDNTLNDIDHYSSYQARFSYQGSEDVINYLNGIRVFDQHVGTGYVPNYYGIRVDEIGGTGAIGNNYGIYIGNITKGTGTRFALYIEGGGARIGGDAYVTGKLAIGTSSTTYQLNVLGEASITGITKVLGVQIGGDGNIKGAFFANEDGDSVIQTIAGKNLNIEVEAVKRFSFTPNGSISNRDMEVDNSSFGIILRAPNNNRYRVQVDNAGTLITTLI